MIKIVLLTALLALLLALAGCGAAEILSPAVQETPLPESAVPLVAVPTQTLSREQAQEIALRHAGLTARDVTGLETDFDWDDNRWDVDFRAGNWEYEYDIHAGTGEIIKVDKEYTPGKSPGSQPANPPARLTAEDVRAIALKHAGLAENRIRFLRVEFDYDDGVPRYAVEFVADGWEYEYNIHAETGTVLSFDKGR